MYFDQVSNQGIFKSEDFGYCWYVKVGKEVLIYVIQKSQGQRLPFIGS
ncbi:hypothetical protein JCM17380_06990 [Desulfosporosinus burensis]